MRRILSLILPMIFAFAGMFIMPDSAHAASYGVQDNAGLFSKDAASKADDVIRQIRSTDDRDVLVVTFDAIPADMQDEYKNKGKEKFYADWAENIGKEKGTSGVVILLIKEPGHLQVEVGNKTRQRSFTINDRDALSAKMLSLLKDRRYDDALITGVDFIKERMRRATANAGTVSQNSGNSGSSTPFAPGPGNLKPGGFPFGGLLCAGIVILIVVVVIINIVTRSRGYGGGGYGAPPPGGYPPNYGGYQGGGGSYGGGGGGGFGRGLLGGLLGGALGAWGYEKFNQGSSNQNYPQNQGGGGGNTPDQTDTSFSGTGGDFGSSGGGGGGGDFGSSSDSGGGGSDFGGGGGGGGGDFGGGGDSGGGSSGGDF